MIQSVALVILKMVLVCLALSVAALLVALLIPLKVAVQEFLKEFGFKKTMAGAIMALILLPIATAHAGDTIARIEDGKLVYYEKVRVVPGIVPSGITDEQARQLVEGVIPSVKLSANEEGFYFGLPIAEIKTDTIISFRGGWIKDEKMSDESLSVPNVLVISTLMLYAFFTAYTNNSGANFFMVTFFTLLTVVVAFSWDATFTQVVVALWTLSFVSYLPGRYLRRRKEKRQNAKSHVLEVETVLEIET